MSGAPRALNGKIEGDMRLYGFWRSIATYRVRLALALKELPFEEVPINLMEGRQNEDSFLAVNPGAALPALEIDGVVLVQSAAIMEYLEERFPGRPLLPSSPVDRALARALAFETVADAHPLIVPRVRHRLAAAFGAGEDAVADWARHWLARTLEIYEARLAARPPAPFVFGGQPGIADIAIQSHAVACSFFEVPVPPGSRVGSLSQAVDAVPGLAEMHPLKVRERSA